jgi:subtilisin family serine protease
MASPHVAGAVALLLSADPQATPAEVSAAIVSGALTGLVSSAGTGSPNRLLYTLAEPVVPQTVAVASLSGARTKLKNGWRATVTVKVGQSADLSTGVSGATVSGRFGSASTISCITGSAGTCTLTSTNFKNTIGSVTFSVTGVSGNAMTYDSAANAASQVVIYKP